MSTYIIRRLLVAFPILIVVTIINFTLMHLSPGDPITFMLRPSDADGTIKISRDAGGLRFGEAGVEYRQILEERFGLDKPIYVQYFYWLKNLAQGNFGRSMIRQTDIGEELWRRVKVTVQLTVSSLIVSLVVGLVLGVLSALYQYSILDVFSTIGSFVLLSVPAFFFALVAVYFFALKWPVLPPGQMYTVGGGEPDLWDRIVHMILPVGVMGLSGSASFIRFARASMLDVLGADYITVARAKGLSERIVMLRHAFRNALMPLVTIASYRLPVLFGGSVLIETVFGWPGIGKWSAQAAAVKDYPILMATVFFTAVFTLSANLLADIAYGFVDPRVRYD